MRNKTALFVFAACMAAGVAFAETDENGKQSSAGDKSPVINAGGNVSVNYGMDEKRFEAMLKAQEERIVSQLKEPGRISDDKERLLWEQKLKNVQGKLADIEKSYEEELNKRKATDEALAQIKGQLPEIQIENAQASLRQGDKDAAKQIFREVAEKNGGTVALATYQLGQMAESDLDYTEALRQYKKAVVLEENNPEYLLAAGKMARTMADYKQAEEWLELLLKIREANGKNNLELAIAQNELASLYEDIDKYKEAEPLLHSSLAIKEKIFSEDSFEISFALNRLVFFYRHEGSYKKAEPFFHRLIAISEKADRKDDLHVVEAIYNMALLYEKQGDYVKAEPLFQRIIEIKEKFLGKEHPHVADSINNMAVLYEKIGNSAKAEPLFLRVIEIRKKSLGEDHPYVAAAMNNIATFYESQQRYKDAESFYQKSLYILKNKFPVGHHHIEKVQKNYDRLKQKMAEQQQYTAHEKDHVQPAIAHPPTN